MDNLTIGRVQAEIAADSTKFNAAIEAAAAKLVTFSAQIAKAERELEQANKKREEAARKLADGNEKQAEVIERLDDKIFNLNARIERLTNSSIKAAAGMSEAAQAQRELSKEADTAVVAIEKEVAVIDKSVVAMSKMQMGQSLQNLGGMMESNITQPIVNGLKTIYEAGVAYNVQMQSYSASFTTMMGDAVKSAELMETLKTRAAETPYGLDDLAGNVQLLMSFGQTADEAVKHMNELGDIAQGNKERFSSLSLAFAQATSTGKLMGQDLNQMINAGFNPLEEMSRKTGKSIGELRNDMSKGAISAKDLADAFASATSEGGKFYNAMNAQADTYAGQMARINDEYNAAAGKLAEKVMPLMMKGMEFTTGLLAGFAELDPVMQGVIVAFAGILAAADPALSTIGALSSAYAAYTIAAANGTVATTGLAGALTLLRSALLGPVGVIAALAAVTVGIAIADQQFDIFGRHAKELEHVFDNVEFKEIDPKFKETIQTLKTDIDATKAAIEQLNEVEFRSPLEDAELERLTKRLTELEAQLANMGKISPEADFSAMGNETSAMLAQFGLSLDGVALSTKGVTKVTEEQLAALRKAYSAYNDIHKQYKTSADLTKDLENRQKDLSGAINESDKTISDINNAIADNGAEYGFTIEQIRTLIDKYPELAGRITETEKGYRVEIAALEDLRTKTLESLTNTINVEREKTRVVIEEVKRRLQAQLSAEEKLNLYSEDVQKLRQAINEKNVELGRLKSVDAQIDLFSGDGYGTKYDYGKSEADKSGKDSKKSPAEQAFERESNELKFNHDMGYIETKDYYDKLEALTNKYLKKDSDEWRKYTVEIKKYRKEAAEADKQKREKQGDYQVNKLNFYRDMGWDGYDDEKSYINELIRIRDTYFEKWSDGYKKLTLEINDYNKKIAEDERSGRVSDFEKGYKDRLTDSENRVDKKTFYGELTTEETIAAHDRILAYLREYAAEVVNIEGITADERTRISAELNAKIESHERDRYTEQKKLNDEKRADARKELDGMKTDIDEGAFYGKYDTNAQITAWKGYLDKLKEFYQKSLLTKEEYENELRRVNRDIYTLEQKSAQETKDAYDKQMQYYRQVADKVIEEATKRINKQISDAEKAMNDKITALNKQASELRDKYTREDRSEELAKLQERAAVFAPAVTVAGEAEYERIQAQIKSIQREEELYQLDKKNAETIENWRNEFTAYKEARELELENLKDSMAKMIDTSTDVEKSIAKDVASILKAFKETDFSGIIGAFSRLISNSTVLNTSNTNTTNNTINVSVK